MHNTKSMSYQSISSDMDELASFVLLQMRNNSIRTVCVFTDKVKGRSIIDICYNLQEYDEVNYKSKHVIEYETGHVIRTLWRFCRKAAQPYDLIVIDQDLLGDEDVIKFVQSGLEHNTVREIVYWNHKERILARFQRTGLYRFSCLCFITELMTETNITKNS